MKRSHWNWIRCFLTAVLLIDFAAGLDAAPNDPPKIDKDLLFVYRSFNAELETTKQFAEQGVNVRCFFAANTANSLGDPYCEYPPIWLGFSKYDFSALDKQIDDLIRANPKTELICMIDLNTPPWAARKFHFDSFELISHAVCSTAWRKKTAQWMCDFIDYAEKKYGDRIRSYVLSGGGTSEWYEVDYGWTSNLKNSTWASWCKKRNLNYGNEVPSRSSLKLAAHENVVYDPATEGDKITYWQFHNFMVADGILHFAKIARQKIGPKKEIGCFFGYYMVSSKKMTSFGHLDFERVCACPDIDFFISPQTYQDRKIGGGSGPQLVQGTLNRYGKRYMSEIDHSTHVTKNWMRCWENRAEDFAGLKREIAYSLVNHTSLWIFDMWGGRYAEPETRNLIGDLKKRFDKYAGSDAKSIAEILLVADPQSFYYMNEKAEQPSEMAHGFRDKLNQIGAPFDIYAFDDLPEMDLSQYKMICFPATVLITPEREKFLREKVLKDNRIIVWTYAPGICDGKTLDINRVKKWAGFVYKSSGFSITNMNGWRAFYSYDPKEIPPEILKMTAQKAGVHLYTEEMIPVYANEQILAIHMKEGGKKKIALPGTYKKVIEIMSGKIIAENVSSFEYDFANPDTGIFELQK
ncbi:MAG: hypothetical protein Q4G69_06470 [Planctomycetia bacterium]|nr:hypothetical protein [Planctomycetia bacterium]